MTSIALLLALGTTAADRGADAGLERTRSAPATVSVRGSIEASLKRVVGAHGPALAAQVARLLRWRGDLIGDIHPRDRLTLDYELDAEGQPALLALRYRGSAISLEGYRFTDVDGVPRFYDQDGLLIEPRMKNNPVPDYVQITEDVQRGRGLRPHNGIDFKAEVGTAIYLPFDATVHRVNWSTRINGNCVQVVYKDSGVVALFLHLHSIAPATKAGAELAAGTQLGTVGNTGRSSAAHLHYELRTSSGTVLRPLNVHGTEPATVSPERIKQFQATVAARRRAMDGSLALTTSREGSRARR